MTAVDEPAAPGLTRPVRDYRPWAGVVRERVVRALPWAVVVAVLVVALLWTQTPIGAIIRFSVYWVLTLVVPGTLVHRAVRGSRGNLPEDVGLGIATGLVLELVAWAVATAVGLQSWLWAWPIPVLVAFIAVGRLRAHWRIEEPRPLPLAWSWAIAAVMVLGVGWALTQWVGNPLPPTTYAYYVDMPYLLSLVHELTRSMPFETPQVAGSGLRYHYLSYAHMAAGSLITGVDPSMVFLRLWLGPILYAAVLALAAVARQVTGRWWAGPAAAGLAILIPPLNLGGPMQAAGGSAVSAYSPSLTYMLVLLMLLTTLCLGVVRGHRIGGGWFLLAGAAVACAGAKASGLPLLAAGMLAASAASLVMRRRVPWSILGAIAVLLGAMLVGVALFVGGGAGALSVRLLGIERWMPPFQSTVGVESGTEPGLLPMGLSEASRSEWALALGLLVWWLLLQASCLVGLLALFRPRIRTDPAAWLLAGAMIAGVGAMWTLDSPSASQVNFMRSAIAFGAVLTIWLLADAMPARSWSPVLVLAAGFGFALAWVLHNHFLPGGLGVRARPAPTVGSWGAALAAPLAWACVAGLAVAVAWLLLRTRLPALRERGVAVAVTAVLGAGCAAAWFGTGPAVVRAVDGGVRAQPASGPATTVAEIRAAQWLDKHAAADDVVATNVHCRPIVTIPHCDARAFWVTAFGGRRTVIEGWAYTDAAVAADGRDGRGFVRQLAPDGTRYALNERVFVDPSLKAVTMLRTLYGARWLFADRRAGSVSPRLSDYAVVRYEDGPVTIYEFTSSG